MEKTIVLIGSPSRSGSTMMDLILGNGPNNFSLGEVHAHFRPYRKHHFNSKCNCGDDPCSIRNKIILYPVNKLHQNIFEDFKVDFIIDSSKNLNWIVDVNHWTKSQGIKVINLLIYKNPISHSYSYFKRGWDIMHWRKQYIYFKYFFETGLPYISICYNEFTNDSTDSLRKLCNAIKMPFFEKKESYWETKYHHFFGSDSVKRMIKPHKKLITSGEKYSEEFRKLIPELESRLESDQVFQSIKNRLEKRDVLKNDVDWVNEIDKINYPWWYYKNKIMEYYHKKFPGEKASQN